MTDLSRRRFLHHTLQSAAFVSAAGIGPSIFANSAFARETDAKIVSTPLGDNLRVLSGAGCNVVVLQSNDGVLLVDGGLKQHSAALLKEALQGSSASRVRMLFNTHWHPEQVGLNERISKSGVTIIAHENTKLWLSRPIKVDWSEQSFVPLPEKARPNRITYTTDTVSFGGEDIEYGYLRQAHTDGDLYVHFRRANVLAAGGVVSADGWPLLDYQTGGWIGGLVAGYDKLLKISNDTTRIVPANGPILKRADLEAQRKMYFTIYERVVACLNKGLGPDECVATQPAKEYAAQWGDPSRFLDSAFRSLWGHFVPEG